MANLGFVGLGVMGGQMVNRLLQVENNFRLPQSNRDEHPRYWRYKDFPLITPDRWLADFEKIAIRETTFAR